MRHQRQTHAAAGGVAGGPGFSRPGVGRMAIDAQRAAVGPGVGERADDLSFVPPSMAVATALVATRTSRT